MKHLPIIRLLLLGTTVLSCESQLEEKPIGLITQDQINTEPTAASITSAVDASYQLLSSTLNIIGEWDWTGGRVLRNDFILQDMAAGDMQKKWNPDGDQVWMDEVAGFSFTSINGAFNGLWSYDYEGISRVNQAISTLENQDVLSATDLDTSVRDRLLGEAYFLRAFYYLDLLNNFGGVPLLTEPLQSFEEAYSVATRRDETEVLEVIKTDLQRAADLLPPQKYSSESEPWRASFGAAKALQAKVALREENWTTAIENINELDAYQFYALNPHYFDAFNVTDEYEESEVIFAYDHRQEVNPSEGNGLGALMGWGFVAPTADFIAAFTNGDPRLGYTIDTVAQQANKLLGSTDGRYKGNEDSPGNRVFIRYADVLLWKAEALIELGRVEEGLEIIDRIRERARHTPMLDGSEPPAEALPNYAGLGLSQQEALDALRHERRVELGFESHRFNDLKRWKIAEEVLTRLGKNFRDENYLYPIPQGEIDRSGGQIEQNPGY